MCGGNRNLTFIVANVSGFRPQAGFELEGNPVKKDDKLVSSCSAKLFALNYGDSLI